MITENSTRPISEEEAASFRAEFPIFDETTYLNSCSLGPLSRRSRSAVEQYLDDWSRWGAPAWFHVWMAKLTEARERFARLIGAEPHEVTISHSISSALSSVASAFDYRERPAVTCADIDFPTIAYQWLAKAHTGVQVRFARSDDRISVPLSAYENTVDSKTALIATSHIFYATGAVQPIRQLADLAHANGARLVVDGYHSVGVMPVNVKELDVDIYVGGVLKWLCGGPGLTFIYVRESLLEEMRPTITGWFAAADQFGFDTTNFEPAASADRMTLGTPSVATAYAGVAGMDMILEADPKRIYPRVQALTNRIVQHARSRGYPINSPLEAKERGGVVMLRLDRPPETVEELASRGFTVDYRPGLVRISPHFYNTASDVDGVLAAIDEIQGK